MTTARTWIDKASCGLRPARNERIVRRRAGIALPVAVLGFLLAWLALAAPALAEAAEVTLEVIPAAVEIPLDGQAEALVVVRNPLTETLRNVSLSWFGPAPVTVTATAPASTEVPPGAALTWTLRLARRGTQPTASTLHLVLNYRVAAAQEDVQAVATSDLTVTLAVARSVGQVVPELIPATVEVPLEGQATALVVVHNTLTETLRNVGLSWFGAAPVTVSATPAGSTALLPGGAVTWTLRLARQDLEPAVSELWVVLNYQVRVEQGDLQMVTTAPLSVTLASVQTVGDVVQVRLETALSQLLQPKKGDLYVVVTNTLDAPVQLAGVTISRPEGVTATISGSSAAIAAGDTYVVPVQIAAPGRIAPGQGLLLMQLDFSWQQAGRPRSGSVVLTHPLQTGIVGESQVLPLLGVPTILLLPGVLMLATLGLLWRVWPRGTFWLPPTEAGFWPVAVTLSGLAIIVYQWRTGSSFLEAYSLTDIWHLWMGSIGCALFAWALWGALYLLQRLLATRYTPKEGDTALQTLHKLVAVGLTSVRPQYQLDVGGTQQTLYLLEKPDSSKAKQWVAPQMTFSLKTNRPEDQLWVQQVYAALQGDTPDTKGLLKLLEAAGKDKYELTWPTQGPILGPFPIESTKLVSPLGNQSIIGL